jgi:serine protease Do
MTTFRKTVSTFAIALIGGLAGVGAYKMAGFDQKEIIFQDSPNTAVYRVGNITGTQPVNFVDAAAKATSAVVHIKASQTKKRVSNGSINPLFREFFGDEFFRDRGGESQPQVGTGSGVIMSTEGYILTNNHVVDGADELTVTLNDNRSLKAKVIGVDASTDLAIIKIEADKLAPITIGNSDEVKVGEWVLAVGNPMNLTSTVTAGIVSAKARSINILREKSSVPIEAFIQTDAAINPGNSGGALVDVNGNLIGINTAIASTTGSYTGYGFAVPINIAKKVMEDIMKFGVVQRAFLGITIRDLNTELAEELNIKVSEGVYVDSVLASGSAADAGLKKSDVIVKADNTPIKSVPQLQEQIGRHRPGDAIELLVIRDGKEKNITVVLKNKDNKKEVVKKDNKNVSEVLGIELATVEEKDLKKMKIDGGVKVTKINSGTIRYNTDMQEGFIITKIDRQEVKTVDDVQEILKNKKGGVMIEGIYEKNPENNYYYAFGM